MRTTLTVIVMMLVLAGCDASQQAADSGSEADQPGAEGADSAAGSDAASRATPSPEGQSGADSEGHDGGHSEPVDVPAEAQRRQVEGTEFAFAPAELTVETGRPVAVTLTNAGEVEHEWELVDDDGSTIGHAHAGVGEDATVVFTLDEPGTYEVRCNISGHAEQGMVGNVTAR